MTSQFILGTYTKKTSKGIYAGSLDQNKRALTRTELVIEQTNPTYLAMSQENNLYTVGADSKNNGIVAYKKHSNAYEYLNAVTADGSAPCYVSIDEARQLVYSTNYHAGTVRSYRIEKNGGLMLADEKKHSHATGPHPNQDAPHIHYADLTPDNRVVTCDLGTDEVTTYDVDAVGHFTEVAIYKANPGCGPRHLVFHPFNNLAYLIGELDSSVTVLTYFDDGHFEAGQTISTLPKSFPERNNAGGAIKISNDGRHLYASNRGHNSIAVYTLEDAGLHLELVEIIPSGGDFPRDFALDPTEEFLVCTHQKSDNLSLFARDAHGKLTMLSNDTVAPEAVCIKFLEN